MTRKTWLNKDKAVFLQRLGHLLHQGYPFIVAIEMLSFQEKPKIHAQINIMLEQLRHGEALYEVLLFLKFPSDVCGFIFFAERHGDLALGLVEGGAMLQRRERSKHQFQQMIKYPVFLLWLLFLVFYMMMTYLYPQFQSLYQAMDIQLPLITRMLLAINHYATPVFLPSLLLLSLFMLIVYRYFKKTSIFTLLDVILKIPYVSRMVRLYITYFLALHLGSLLKVGMSIQTAFQVISKQTLMSFYQREAERVIILLKHGESLDKAFIGQPFYVKEFNHIIAHGQMNGMLGQELVDYSQMIMTEMEEHLKRTFAMIQPMLLVAIGGFTLLLFLSILLPIFQMMNGF